MKIALLSAAVIGLAACAPSGASISDRAANLCQIAAERHALAAAAVREARQDPGMAELIEPRLDTLRSTAAGLRLFCGMLVPRVEGETDAIS